MNNQNRFNQQIGYGNQQQMQYGMNQNPQQMFNQQQMNPQFQQQQFNPMMNQFGQQNMMMGRGQQGMMMGRGQQGMMMGRGQQNMMMGRGQQGMMTNQFQQNQMMNNQQQGFNQGMNKQQMGIQSQQPQKMMNQFINQPQQTQQIMNQGVNQPQQTQQMMNQGMNQPQQPQQMNQQPQQPQKMMNQQQQQQVQPQQGVAGVTQQAKPAQGLRPVLFDGLDLHELPLWPIQEEDCVYPPPQPFQKPSPDPNLPPQLLNDITQNEQQLSSQSLAPLQQLTGQQFHFYCDYHEFLMTKQKKWNGKVVTDSEIPTLCTTMCGKFLTRWVTSIVGWFEDIRKNNHPDIRWYIRKFLEACSTRTITVRLDVKGPEFDRAKHGRMAFENGVCVIYSACDTNWSDFGIDYSISKKNLAGRHPFHAIENGLDERGMIESQMYFQKNCVKRYLDAKKKLEDTFGCEWVYEFDARQLFRDYQEVCVVHDKTTFGTLNYMMNRQYHKHYIVVYFEKMVARLCDSVTVNGSIDPKCVQAVLQHIPTKTIVLKLEGMNRERDVKWYELSLIEGKVVMRIHYWVTNIDEIYQPKALNMNCIENLVVIERIPLIAYKNLREKADTIEEDCRKRLEAITGVGDWKFSVNLALTYKKLRQTHANEVSQFELFPEILMCYVRTAVEKIEVFDQRVKKLAPEQGSEPIEEEEELDSEEEEEDEQTKKLVIPFSVRNVLLENIPTRTIQVKYLTKISKPVEPCLFVEMREGKMVIKIISWNTNRHTVLDTRLTGFGMLFTHDRCPLTYWMDYFEQQSTNEISMKNDLGKCLGTTSWNFEYRMGEIYEFVKSDGNAGSYLKQMGYQFMRYFQEVVTVITAQSKADSGWKSRFLKRFGEKRTIALGFGKSGAPGGKYFEYVDRQGVLVMEVRQWLVNLVADIRKLGTFV